MIKACVAKQYDVQLSVIDDDDLIYTIISAGEDLEYDQLIVFRTSDDSIIELDKATLETMLEDDYIDGPIRRSIKKLLDDSDPDHDFVHIEAVEVL